MSSLRTPLLLALLLALGSAPGALQGEVPPRDPKARTVDVRVRATKAGLAGSGAASGLRLSAGVVEVEGRVDWETPALLTGTTDVDGRWRTTMEVPASELDTGRLWVRVEEPGWAGNIRLGRLEERLPYPVHVECLEARRLEGKVVAPGGRPLKWARVGLVSVERPGPPMWALAREDGRFVTFVEAEGPYFFTVIGGGGGVVTTEPLPLDPDALPEGLTLQLAESRSLRLRVRDLEGNPVRVLYLGIVPTALEPFARRISQVGAPFFVHRRADPEGNAVFEGLEEGEYTLFASLTEPLHFKEPWMRRLGTLEVGDDPGPRDLQYSFPRLEVRLRGPGADVPEREPARRWGSGLAPGRLHLEGPGRGWKSAVRGGAAAEGVTQYGLQPGRLYRLAFQDDRFPYFERELELPPGSQCLEIDLHLPLPIEPRPIEFRVSAPEGVPYRFESSGLTIRAARSGRVVARIPMGHFSRVESGLCRSTLPPGTYWLSAHSSHSTGDAVSPITPRVTHGTSSRTFEVVGGRSGRITRAVEPGGHLDLFSIRDLPEPAPPFEQRRNGFSSRGQDDDEPASAAAFVVSSSGERRPLGFQVPRRTTYLRQEWLVFGWNARGITPIPEGEWTFVLEREGRVFYRRPVRIVAGEVTELFW